MGSCSQPTSMASTGWNWIQDKKLLKCRELSPLSFPSGTVCCTSWCFKQTDDPVYLWQDYIFIFLTFFLFNHGGMYHFLKHRLLPLFSKCWFKTVIMTNRCLHVLKVDVRCLWEGMTTRAGDKYAWPPEKVQRKASTIPQRAVALLLKLAGNISLYTIIQ